MDPRLVHGRRPGEQPSYGVELGELLRILLVAGLTVGLVGVGVGSRLTMYALRLTSPDSVTGRLSDDGFVIGRFTASGTYNLVVLGAVVGVIGAAAYVAVAPWLVGPTWLRRVAVGATAAALVGSMVIHADGIDFTLLKPLWLCVSLFVALPLLVGMVLAVVVDRVAAPTSWTAQDPYRWMVPSVLVALVPGALLVLIPVGLVIAALLPVRRSFLEPLRRSSVGTLGARAAFASVPVVGFVSLGRDLAQLY